MWLVLSLFHTLHYSKQLQSFIKKLSSTSQFTYWYLKVCFTFWISVPGPPSNIKALPVDRNSIMISWMPPDKPNGEILGYSLYMKTMELGRQFTQDFPLASHVNYYTMGGLNQVQTFMHYTYLRMYRIIVRWIENTFIHG